MVASAAPSPPADQPIGPSAGTVAAIAGPQRWLWVDGIKGIAIFLVVLGHVLGGLAAANILVNNPPVDFLRRWIYAFHMPAFFFVAGLFAFRSLGRGHGAFVISKFRTLLYPYAIWTVIQWSSHEMMSRYTNTQPDRLQLLYSFYKPYMNLWFLYGLFLVFVIFAGLTLLSRSRWMLLVAGIILYAVGQLDLIRSWDILNRAADNFIYLALGAALAPWCSTLAAKISKAPALLLSAISFGLMSLLVHRGWDTMLWPPVILAILGTAGTYFLVLGIGAIDRPVALLGVFSLEIYLVHGIVSVPTRIALSRLFHLRAAFPHVVAGMATGILIPIALAMLCNRLDFPYLFTLPRHRGASPRESAASTTAVAAPVA